MWHIGSAPDFWGRGPGFESGISHNDHDAESLCHKVENLMVVRATYPSGKKIFLKKYWPFRAESVLTKTDPKHWLTVVRFRTDARRYYCPDKALESVFRIRFFFPDPDQTFFSSDRPKKRIRSGKIRIREETS